MDGTSERLSAAFHAWEVRGRGYRLYDYSVELEPVFVPHKVARPAFAPHDDGRRDTFLSALVRRASARLAPEALPVTREEEGDPLPSELVRGELVELRAHLGAKESGGVGRFTRLLQSLLVLSAPVSFELISDGECIALVFSVAPCDERLFRKQFAAFFPDTALSNASGFLNGRWAAGEERFTALADFGLGRESVLPIDCDDEPFVALAGALSEVTRGELAVYQVLFCPALAPWEDSIVRSVSRSDGSALFVNAPELLPGAKRKASSPIWAAVVRIAARANTVERAWEIACNVGGALGTYGTRDGNRLVPLSNEGYGHVAHAEDVVLRQTRRSGMIVNAEELAGFVHLPTDEVRSPLLRSTKKTKAAPEGRPSSGALLGYNDHNGAAREVRLSDEERTRHVHVIGATGTAKSSLLFNLITEDMRRGVGLTLIEPHGDLARKVLSAVPQERIGDVIVLDPSDEGHVVGFDVLRARSDWEKAMLASDLVAVFRRMATSWGDQLNSVLHNAVMAFLESERGGTLLDLRRFLVEPAFRKEFLGTIRDEAVLYYWNHAFPHLAGGKSVGPVVTRLDAFLSPRPIRDMVSRREGAIDLRKVMDEGKILIARLPRGRIGDENAHILGGFLIARLQSEAMSRQDKEENARRLHILYADEFSEFLTPSLAGCLSGVRKQKLGLVLAHQEMRQVEREPEVASALLSNAYTRIVFRVGERDARTLSEGFSAFDAKDLTRLRAGAAICRIERSDGDFNLRVPWPEYPSKEDGERRLREVIAASRERYGAPRAVGALSASACMPEVPTPAPVAPKPAHAAPAPMPASPGVGGAQHMEVQRRIKEAAEALGFRVIAEKEVPKGKIDLVLARDGTEIACEITITNTIDYEIHNIAKCLAAGFQRVVVVSTSESKLAKLSAAAMNTFGAEEAKALSFHLPDAFIASLSGEAMPKTVAPKEEVRTRGGRVVRRKFADVSECEAKAKEADALRLMEENMRKRAKK
jgi:hypothetical protein